MQTILGFKSIKCIEQSIEYYFKKLKSNLVSFDWVYSRLDTLSGRAFATFSRHPNEEMRNKGKEALDVIEKAKAKLLGMLDIYHTIKKQVFSNPMDIAAQKVALRLFENAGTHLSTAQRERIASITVEIEDLNDQFQRVVADYAEMNKIMVNGNLMAVLPQHYGMLYSTVTDHDLSIKLAEIMRNSDYVKLLEIVHKAQMLQAERASILGKTVREYSVGSSMFNGYEQIAEFNDKLLKALNTATKNKLEELGYTDSMVEPVVMRYWLQRLEDETDPMKGAKFPVNKILLATMEYFSKLLNIKFKEIPNDGLGTYRVFKITHKGGRETTLVVDIFPDEGRPEMHPMCMFIGNKTQWITQEPTFKEGTSELEFESIDDVTVLLHELGHAFHVACTNQKYYIIGSEIQSELVEVPSQLAETFWHNFDPAIFGLERLPKFNAKIDLVMQARQAYLAVLVETISGNTSLNLEDLYHAVRSKSIFDDDYIGCTMPHIVHSGPNYHMYTMGEVIVFALIGKEESAFKALTQLANPGEAIFNLIGGIDGAVENYLALAA